jgi:signal transduction histidine kinase
MVATCPKNRLQAGLLALACMFLFLSCTSAKALAADAVEPLRLGSSGAYEIGGHLSVLKDPSRTLTLERVIAADRGGRLAGLPYNLNEGYARSAFWVHFTLVRDASFPDTCWLRLTPSYTDEVTVYIQAPGSDPSKASSYQEVLLGDHVPAWRRPLIHPDFVVPVTLEQGQPVEIYIRVFSNSSISLAGQIHTQNDLRDHTYRDIMFQSAYLGIALVIFLMNLIFFISIRDRLFLFFSLYVLMDILNNLAIEGMLTLLYPGVVHLVSDIFVYMGIGAKFLVFAEFSYTFFKESASRWILGYLRAMSFMGLLTVVSVPLGAYPLIMPFSFTGMLVMIVLLLWHSRRMIPLAPGSGILMFLAFAVSTVGYAFEILRLLGVIPLNLAWDLNTIQPAALIHLTLISLALSERLRMAQRQAVESSMQAEHKAVAMADEMTRELRENKERLEVALESEHVALERQQQFLAMVSHEYRTPLAIIQGNLDIMVMNREECSGPEDEEVTKMRSAIQRLVEVMEVSLEQSRLMDFHAREKYRQISVREFVSHQVDSAAWMWPKRRFLLVESVTDGLISGDLPLLNTVLFNLLDNAQKYSPDGTDISIDCSISGGMAHIDVRNRSAGLSHADHSRLFEKYHRGNNSQNTAGAGIGLWLAQRIVEQHGGRIVFDCDRDGKVHVSLNLPVDVA